MIRTIAEFFGNPWTKGQYDFLTARRRQQLRLAVLCALLVAGFVTAGLLIYHKRANILMIPGLFSVLPFANFLVTLIALSSGKVLGEERREAVRRFEDSGMLLYHLFYVDEKGRQHFFDCTVVYQGGIVAYCTKVNADRKTDVETDLILRLQKKGIPLRLKIFTDWEEYLKRIADIEAAVPENEVNKVEKAEELLLGMCL